MSPLYQNVEKGILGKITLNGEAVTNWTITQIPLDNVQMSQLETKSNQVENNSPHIFRGEFILSSSQVINPFPLFSKKGGLF